MRITSSVVLAPAALLIAGAFVTPRDAAGEVPLKCGNRLTAPGTVIVVDAKVMDSAAVAAVDQSAIESIGVECSDKRHEVWGVEPGRALIVVFTYKGPAGAVRAALDSITVLQERYAAKHKRFAKQLKDLGWRNQGDVTVELLVNDEGSHWSAKASHPLMIDQSRTATGSLKPGG